MGGSSFRLLKTESEEVANAGRVRGAWARFGERFHQTVNSYLKIIGNEYFASLIDEVLEASASGGRVPR